MNIKEQEWIGDYLICYDSYAKSEISYHLPHWQGILFDIMIRMQKFHREYFYDEKPRIYAEISVADKDDALCLTLRIENTGIKIEQFFTFRGQRTSEFAGLTVAKIFNIHNHETADMLNMFLDVLFIDLRRYLVLSYIDEQTKLWATQC